MMAPHSVSAPCGCKGIRRCLLCERLKGEAQLEADTPKVNTHETEKSLLLCFYQQEAAAASYGSPEVSGSLCVFTSARPMQLKHISVTL